MSSAWCWALSMKLWSTDQVLTLLESRSRSIKPGWGMERAGAWGLILIGWGLFGEVTLAESWMKARSRSWEDWGRSVGTGDRQQVQRS